MSRRTYWNAVRMVAEDIRAGERRSWKLARNPHLTSSGWEAIKELEAEGLITVADYHVEPTPAFWPWLEELRAAEDAKAMARQKAMPTAWRVPAPASEPSEPVAVVLAVPEPTSQISLTRAPATSGSRRPQVLRPDLTRFEEFCVRVLDCLRHHSGRMTSSELRRGVSGYRHPEIYDLALEKLQRLKAIEVEKEPGNRRVWVTLLKIPPKYEATRPKPKRQRYEPHSRGQTEWFKRLMEEYELED